MRLVINFQGDHRFWNTKNIADKQPRDYCALHWDIDQFVLDGRRVLAKKWFKFPLSGDSNFVFKNIDELAFLKLE